MKKYNLKSIVDAKTGNTYLIDKNTKKIVSYRDKTGNIYNNVNKLVATI
ncbi:hypothetical protein MED152_16983 [Polaribacter sp. MED152]|nr:hypothetical protein MED152_16983 [Polaribacter sp. MED152]